MVSFIVCFAHLNGSSPDSDEINDGIKTIEAYNTMMEVITHKRCVNCHPSGDRPLQGEDSHLHYFGVQRGEDNQGLAGYKCGTCHGKENNNYSGVPGAPHWALAPIEFAWEGKTKSEIAKQMMDPKRNGGRSHADIIHHLTEDTLVLWAFDPGVNAEGIEREKPPVSKENYIKAVKDWIAAGAIIPE
jgi:mono/diheme cytochrome c family protein